MERDDVFQGDPSGRSPLALAPRTLLNEQFRVGRVLGVGGFGITYLAFDEVLEMVVAVKEYLPNNIAVRKTGSNTVQPLSSSGGDQDFEFGLQRFLQEARTLAKFEAHENIVRVRTFFRENGTGYLVMNFYEGRTLAEYLAARNGFLPEQEALLIMEQVVEGLTAVHEENILHRDVDPNNVYLADNGTVVLLDFGAARTAVGERTRTMSVVLKRGYAPHEQYHSHGDQGPWTDVYACAATLYRTLTGYKPPEAAARILEDDLAPPSELVPSLSDATNEAVVKGLAVRPQDRPQTVGDFAALLPDPSSDAEPGWIGELTTVDASPDRDGASAELRVSVTHACRLYVDGSRTADLAPEETYRLGLDVGTHRLRAIRTDQSNEGTATVTASGTSIEKGSDRRMSLDALVWQDVVVTSAEEPTVVTVDFTEARSDTTLSTPTEQVEDAGPEAAPAETGSTETGTATGVSAGGDRASDTGGTTVTDRGGGGTARSATLQVHTDRSAHLFIEGEREAHLDSEEAYRTTLPAGVYRLRAEAAGGAERWEQEVAVPAGTSRSVRVSLDRTGLRGGRSSSTLTGGGMGVGVLVLLLVLGWWIGASEAPEPRPDRLLTTADAEVVDVVGNDRDPEGEGVHVVSAGPLPDSVAQVEVVDSSRLRIRPTAGFGGTARVPYEVANAAGHTAESFVSLRVPFSGAQHVLARGVDQPQVVHPDSLGEDGDLDVLIASLGTQALTWSENSGAGPARFESPRPIESAVDGMVDVATADLNDSGRRDVVAASLEDDVVAWYENQGEGAFGDAQPLASDADGAVAVETADFEGDGDVDVVAGALLDGTVRWYENEGGGTFAEGKVLADGVGGLETLHISDLDGDDVPDVLVVSYRDSTIRRYEPQVSASDSLTFVERPPVGTLLREPISIHTADVIGNGRPDVLAGKAGEESLVLYENRRGKGDRLTFGNKRILASGLQTVESIDTGDVDGDGDQDIFAASFDTGEVVWFENLGGGSFGPAQPVLTDVPDVISLSVADVDADGDVDVFAASQADGTVGWVENYLQ